MWHRFFIVSSRSVDSSLDTSGLVAAESDTSRHCNGGKSHIDWFSISDKYFIIFLLLFITSLQEIAFSSLASVGWMRISPLTFIHRNFSHLNVRCLWADFSQVLPLLVFPASQFQIFLIMQHNKYINLQFSYIYMKYCIFSQNSTINLRLTDPQDVYGCDLHHLLHGYLCKYVMSIYLESLHYYVKRKTLQSNVRDIRLYSNLLYNSGVI